MDRAVGDASRAEDAHGVLGEVDRFLRELPEREWAHLGEFLTRPTG
jgi:hypothetical protein